MEALINIALNGLNAPDAGLAVARAAAGTFFAISGFHKLFNKDRHARLVQTLTEDKVPAVWFNQWWVPFWELTAGTMLVLGLGAVFAAGVLTVICTVACIAEAGKRVEAYKPINAADRLDDYLYIPEVMYLILLVVFLVTGPGAYSLDRIFFGG